MYSLFSVFILYFDLFLGKFMVHFYQIGIKESGERMEGGMSDLPRMMFLKSHNFLDWKIKMKDLLIIKDLYEPTNKEEIPMGVLECEWKF